MQCERDVERKSVLCQQKKLALHKKVFHVDKNKMIRHQKKQKFPQKISCFTLALLHGFEKRELTSAQKSHPLPDNSGETYLHLI